MADYLMELNELQKSLGWLLNKELLKELVELQEMLNRSYVNQYVDFVERTKDASCQCQGWALRAKELFVKLQEEAISAKIEAIYRNFIEKK